MMKQRNFNLIIVALFLILSACIKDVEDTNIPKVNVRRITIELDDARTVDLNAIGIAVALEDISPYFANLGVNGIVVIQVSAGVYYAYDQCCTNEPEKRHKLEPDGALAECTVCNSKFLLLDGLGTYLSGPAPAQYNLRKYNISKTGNYLVISN